MSVAVTIGVKVSNWLKSELQGWWFDYKVLHKQSMKQNPNSYLTDNINKNSHLRDSFLTRMSKNHVIRINNFISAF